MEQLQWLAAGKADRGACDEVEPGAEGEVLYHAGNGHLADGRFVHRPDYDLRGRAGDAASGELEFSRVHRQLQGRLLVDQGERASTARTAPSKV